MRSRQWYYMDLKYLSKYFSFKSFYFIFQWCDLLRCLGPPSTLNKQRLHAICLSHRIISWVISWLLLSLKWVLSVRTERIHSKSLLLRVSFLFHCRFPTSWRTLSFSLLFIYRRVSCRLSVSTMTVSKFVCSTDILFGLRSTFMLLILTHDDIILSSRFLVAFYKNICPVEKNISY